MGLVGCNLADYEARMAQAQELQKQRDAEHAALDRAVDLPGYKEGPAPNILFRLPLGINPQPENREKPFADLLYQYVRKQAPTQPGQPAQPGQPGMPPNPPQPQPPTGSNTAPGLVDVFLAHRVGSSKAVGELIEEVRKQFPVPTQEPVKRKRRFTPVGREPFELDLIEWQDVNYAYLLATAANPKTQVVAVYRMEKGKQAGIQRVLDLSLQTLALDDVASKLRLGYGEDLVRRPPR